MENFLKHVIWRLSILATRNCVKSEFLLNTELILICFIVFSIICPYVIV